MIYPKITRFNYRRRGPFESKKYNNNISDIANAIKELTDNIELTENMINKAKENFHLKEMNIVKSHLKDIDIQLGG